MLLKTARLAHRISPIIYTRTASYTPSIPVVTASFNKPTLSQGFLSRFSQEQTLKALETTVKDIHPVFNPDPKETIVLGKVTENLDSQTYRVFDRYLKRFSVVKTLSLGTESGWRYLNIALRHYHSKDHLIKSLHYDKENNKVVITSSMENVIGKGVVMSEYASYRKENRIQWKEPELKFLTWQLINILNTSRSLGLGCIYLKPEHLIISLRGSTVQLYDYSGFEILSSCLHPHLNMNVILTTLISIIDPGAPVVSHMEARSYLNAHFPEFLAYFQQIESKINSGLGRWLPGRQNKTISLSVDNNLLQHEEHHTKFEEFITGKIKHILTNKDLPNFEEDWAFINQDLGNFKTATKIIEDRARSQLSSGEGEGYLRATLNLAEISQMENPNSEGSLRAFSKVIAMCGSLPTNYLLKAKALNEYGKILLNNGRIEEAWESFRDAKRLLRDVPESSRLKQEVKTNLEYSLGTLDADALRARTQGARPRLNYGLILWSIGFGGIFFWMWNQPDESLEQMNAAGEQGSSNNKVNVDVGPEAFEEYKIQEKKKKVQKWIAWGVFGCSLLASTAMIVI